ncbi:hypothetical protein ACIRJR_30325, partial [Streptomyces sp. NPDC102402]|uniref:hypothetical protein n=1 Tax=Streptomyces sp. NPDC102402 TaxID=3366169 RepID=UPI00382124D9
MTVHPFLKVKKQAGHSTRGSWQTRVILVENPVYQGPGRSAKDCLLIRNSWGSLVEGVADMRGLEVTGDDVRLALS